MKRGFTLVELLATLVVLGIILTITIYSVKGILSNSEDSITDIQKSNIIEGAKGYYIDEGINEESNSNYVTTVCVSVSYLKTNGYIEQTIDEEYKGYVKITQDKTGNITNNNYTYSYVDSNTGCDVTINE